MKNSLPLFFGCSVIAMSLNVAVGIAQQQPQRQMVVPGEKSAIVPPLIVEAGDWDVPQQNQGVSMRSLFTTPGQVANDQSFQGRDSKAVKPAKEPARKEAAKPARDAVDAKAERVVRSGSTTTPQTTTPQTSWASETPKSDGGRAQQQRRVEANADPDAPTGSHAASGPADEDATPKSSAERTSPLSASKPAAGTKPDAPSSGKKALSGAAREISEIEGLGPLKSMKVTEIPLTLSAPKLGANHGKAKLPDLASLNTKDVRPGDILQMKREFQDWNLSCDMNIDKNERVCSINQTIKTGSGNALDWRIATKADGKPVIIFDFAADVDPAAGLSISIAGFGREIPATDWSCADTRCRATMEIAGPVGGWFSNNPDVKFTFVARGAKTTVSASMAGFEKAMMASQNPLGIKPKQAEPQKKDDKADKPEKTAAAQ